jgi:hypothetical protein
MFKKIRYITAVRYVHSAIHATIRPVTVVYRMQAYGRCMLMNLMRLGIIQILTCKKLIFGNFRTIKKVFWLLGRFLASESEKRTFYQSIPVGFGKRPLFKVDSNINIFIIIWTY